MKTLAVHLILLLFTGIVFKTVAQTEEVGYTDNNAAITYTFNKSKLAQDDSNGSGGIMFTSYFSRVGNVTDFFKLRIGETQLLSFSIEDNQFVINRKVKWQECTAWNSSQCISHSEAVYRDMKYYTWDNDFIPTDGGWLSVEIADNGVFIKVSHSGKNGPFLSDLSYGGLHLSAIEDLIHQSPEPNVTLEILSSLASGITLMDLHVYTTGLPYVKAVSVKDNPNAANPEESTSPQTEYAPVPPGEASARVRTTEIILSEEDPASGTVAVYPNPASYQFFLETGFPKETETRLVLYDLWGRPISSYEQTLPAGSNITEFSIDRNKVSTGMLIYVLQYQGKIERGKLLIE